MPEQKPLTSYIRISHGGLLAFKFFWDITSCLSVNTLRLSKDFFVLVYKFLLEIFKPEDECTLSLRNVCKHCSSERASRPRRQDLSLLVLP